MKKVARFSYYLGMQKLFHFLCVQSHKKFIKKKKVVHEINFLMCHGQDGSDQKWVSDDGFYHFSSFPKVTFYIVLFCLFCFLLA